MEAGSQYKKFSDYLGYKFLFPGLPREDLEIGINL